MTRRDAALLAAGAATGAASVLAAAAAWTWLATAAGRADERVLAGARDRYVSGGTVTPLPRGDDRIPAIVSESGPVACLDFACPGDVPESTVPGYRCFHHARESGVRCPDCGGSGDPNRVRWSDLCPRHRAGLL